MSVDIKSHVRVHEWTTYLEGADDVLDWEVHKEGSTVMFFKINYRFRADSEKTSWRVVCRYDTCHGFLHLHRLWLPERSQTLDITERRIPARDYRKAFEAACDDLKANWKTYRAKMER